MSGRHKWLGIGCAIRVLCIWSSFILIPRSSAKHTLSALDLVFVRFLSFGLAVLPWVAQRADRDPDRPTLRGGLSVARGLAVGANAFIPPAVLPNPRPA